MTTYKLSLAQAYSAAAQTYDSAAFVEQQIGRRLLDRLDHVDLKPQRILDLGCGTGYFYQQLRSRLPQASIINLDLAFGMVKFASTNNAREPKVHYLCADAERLPLATQSIDLIFANCCIMHIKKLDVLCRELKRVLTSNGLLIFSAFGPNTLHDLAIPAPWIDMHYYGDALLKAQFTDPVVDVEILNITYDKLRYLLQDLSGTGTYQIDDYSNIENLDASCSASFEVIYGAAWGNIDVPKQTINAEGKHLIPVHSIITLEY